jgi:SseB protein N-terminal domain
MRRQRRARYRLEVSRYLSPGGQQFRGDHGAADPEVAAALAAYAGGQGSEQAALTALAGARLLVPVVARKSEQNDGEMVLPTLVGNDGRTAVLAFTCTDALARWRRDARPVPAESGRVWRAAVADGSAVVIDVAGPVPLAVEGARLAALADGRPVPPPHEDPDIRAEVEAALAGEPGIEGFTLAPGHQDTDLSVTLRLTGRDPRQAAARAAEGIAARLASRLRRGIDFAATVGS